MIRTAIYFVEDRLMAQRLITERLLPTIVATSLFTVVATSAVPPNLLIAEGHPAFGFFIGYALVLLLLAVAPDRYEWFHFLGSALAVIVFGGRAGGFVELALERGDWSLAGAVTERVALAFALIVWHRGRVGNIVFGRQRREVEEEWSGL